MKSRFASAALAVLVSTGVLASAGYVASAAQQSAPAKAPNNFADDAFKNVWTRTDALVDNGSVKRSYFWGPAAGFKTYEQYEEGPDGQHLVQYFDKSRMEINNPNGNKNNPFYVTNGLLTRELVSGQMQLGNNKFVYLYPAEIDLASDTDDISPGTPTYASFRYLAGQYGADAKTGQVVVDTINRAGLTGTDSGYARYNVRDTHYEAATRHNIPDVFWQFLNQTGPVMVNGKVVTARLSDPYFYATGYPISEPYWASVKIAGVTNTDVLIQPYERRVLTYVPTAPAGFKVQMGNIGQHYYDWRYKHAGAPAIQTPVPTPVRNCQQIPIRGFGKIWADHSDVQALLGCGVSPEHGATTTQQTFEHGQMLEIEGFYDYYSGPNPPRFIYVLFDDGTIQRFDDTYVEGSGEPDVTPPPGLFAPKAGLGKVWREGTGARVRERLGWATTPATKAVAPAPPPSRPARVALSSSSSAARWCTRGRSCARFTCCGAPSSTATR
jgi:hypothetical protein